MVQESSDNRYISPPDEISVKEFLRTLISYTKLILKRWYLIVLVFIIFSGYEYKQISQIKSTYPAKSVLFIRPQDIAKENQLYIKIFAQLINSRNLLESTFIKKVTIDETSDLLINHYLKTYYKNKPEEITPDIPFGFRIKSTTLAELDIEERKVFNLAIDKIIKPVAGFEDGFISISANFELGFITISLSSPTEALSLAIISELQKEGIDVFKKSADFADNKAFSNIDSETDSLSNLYKKTYLKLNDYRDRRGRELKKEEPSDSNIKYLEKRIHKYEVRAEIYKTHYLAALEQAKAAQVSLDQNALLIHEMERSTAPIRAYKPSPKVAGIKFGIIGAFLMVFLIVGTRIYFNIAEELKN